MIALSLATATLIALGHTAAAASGVDSPVKLNVFTEWMYAASTRPAASELSTGAPPSSSSGRVGGGWCVKLSSSGELGTPPGAPPSSPPRALRLSAQPRPLPLT